MVSTSGVRKGKNEILNRCLKILFYYFIIIIIYLNDLLYELWKINS